MIPLHHSKWPSTVIHLGMMPLPLTLPCVFNEVHLLGCMVQFGMLLLTSCTPKALDQVGQETKVPQGNGGAAKQLMHTLEDVEKLYGKLFHASLVTPME